MSKDVVNALAVTNTKLAASLWAMGFGWRGEVIQHQDKGLAMTFLFGTPSTRPEYALYGAGIAKEWSDGVLEEKTPMHPLCIMMRAQENYDRMLDMQKGSDMRLIAAAKGAATVYRSGQENVVLKHSTDRVTSDDLALVSAIAGVGIPVISIQGSAPLRSYSMPRYGYARIIEDGVTRRQEDARLLIERAPIAGDPLRLKLEDTNPLHPVVIGYDALHVRSLLKRLVESTKPLLLLQTGQRQALVTMDSTGRVMDKVASHFKAPPIRWNS